MAALNPFLVVMDMPREAERQGRAKDRAKLSIRHGACNVCDGASKSGRRRDGGPRIVGEVRCPAQAAAAALMQNAAKVTRLEELE
jgi:hypothetical protein